jgi:acetylornithine deacetylase/succinyl-diaminopimelate desuccinylase-like protein
VAVSDDGTALLVGRARQAVGAGELRDLLATMVAQPCPWGQERAGAEAVARWIGERAGRAAEVQVFGGSRGNVTVTAGGDPAAAALWVCSHLDTSLDGSPERDLPITGRADPLPARLEGTDTLVGPGLAVARGPAAAATIGFLAATAVLDADRVAHRSRLLLAAGGTHHRHDDIGDPYRFGHGVRHALALGDPPGAVLLAKAGPSAVLHEEPGSAYLDIVLRGRMLPAMLRTDDDPGVPGHLPSVMSVIERWRHGFVIEGGREGPGREMAVGAVCTGAPSKPDLLPAVATICLYVVLAHGDDPRAIAEELGRAVRSTLPGGQGLDVDVRLGPWEPAGRTQPDAPIVRVARAATGVGAGPPGWRGSTDAAVFRAAGIDTARWGPSIAPDPSDGRRDRVESARLVDAARTYGEIIVRYALAGAAARPPG